MNDDIDQNIHEYRVLLSGLNISKEKQKELEEEIRKAALKVLATIDLEKDYKISHKMDAKKWPNPNIGDLEYVGLVGGG